MTNNRSATAQQLVGESLSFSLALDQVSRIAPLDKPVLIVGERGTGKELIAARIHFLSSRWDQAYIQLNCAAISESLQESELFGHEAGAFTGAIRRRSGRFERANGGSLFLDELATTSQRVQEQLLRIIEYGEYERLGGQDTLTTDVRIIAATNEDLPSLARQGRFRFDLLDRLAFDIITLPPLRHREEDIPVLAAHFANNMTRELGRSVFPGFSDEALEALTGYDWPGNIRELKNVVERSLYRHDDWQRPIEQVYIDPFASPYRPLPASSEGSAAKPVGSGANEAVSTSPDDANRNVPPDSNLQFPVDLKALLQLQFPVDLKALLREREVALIKTALQRARFNQTQAARYLGLTYHQLRASLRKYDL